MIPMSDSCMAWHGDTNKTTSTSISMASGQRGNGMEFEGQRELVFHHIRQIGRVSNWQSYCLSRSLQAVGCTMVALMPQYSIFQKWILSALCVFFVPMQASFNILQHWTYLGKSKALKSYDTLYQSIASSHVRQCYAKLVDRSVKLCLLASSIAKQVAIKYLASILCSIIIQNLIRLDHTEGHIQSWLNSGSPLARSQRTLGKDFVIFSLSDGQTLSGLQ